MQDNLIDDIRSEIYDSLFKIYLTGLRTFTIKNKQRKEISRRIITRLEKVKSQGDILEFLKTLSKDYPIFQPAYIQQKYALIKIQEKSVIEKLNKYINTYK